MFYYGVRKYIFESPVLEDKRQVIGDALDVFLSRIRTGLRNRHGPAARPAKAVG